jgi:hypothetical protein
MSIEGRIRRLEGEHADPQEVPAEVEQRRQALRRDAEHTNYCRGRDEEPIFEITAGGDVVCAVDGRPVTDSRQILAERFYWMEVGWGGSDLVHDEEAQAFYSQSGHLAVSRDRVDLRYLMPPDRHGH